MAGAGATGALVEAAGVGQGPDVLWCPLIHPVGEHRVLARLLKQNLAIPEGKGNFNTFTYIFLKKPSSGPSS